MTVTEPTTYWILPIAGPACGTGAGENTLAIALLNVRTYPIHVPVSSSCCKARGVGKGAGAIHVFSTFTEN